jgi:hypothetical protein
MLVHAKHPDFLPGIVKNNLQLAGEERAACTLLTCFATIASNPSPFRACMSGLLELLESPHNYAIAALSQHRHRNQGMGSPSPAIARENLAASQASPRSVARYRFAVVLDWRSGQSLFSARSLSLEGKGLNGNRAISFGSTHCRFIRVATERIAPLSRW